MSVSSIAVSRCRPYHDDLLRKIIWEMIFITRDKEISLVGWGSTPSCFFRIWFRSTAPFGTVCTYLLLFMILSCMSILFSSYGLFTFAHCAIFGLRKRCSRMDGASRRPPKPPPKNQSHLNLYVASFLPTL
jgi:hypothetical protein